MRASLRTGGAGAGAAIHAYLRARREREEENKNKTNAGRRASDMKGGKAGTEAVNHTRDWHVTGREETNDRCVSVAVLASRHRSLRRGGE